jgi:hypothetical protein
MAAPIPPPPPLPPLGVTPAGETDWRSKGFDFAADGTKQLITVATGVLTAAVIFSKDINPDARWWALGAWALLTLSVICGILVLLNMSGHLTRTANTTAPATAATVVVGKPQTYALPNLYLKGIRTLSVLQCLFFTGGLIVMSYFGFLAIEHPPADPKPIVVNCPAFAAPVKQTPAPANPVPVPSKCKGKSKVH